MQVGSQMRGERFHESRVGDKLVDSLAFVKAIFGNMARNFTICLIAEKLAQYLCSLVRVFPTPQTECLLYVLVSPHPL